MSRSLVLVFVLATACGGDVVAGLDGGTPDGTVAVDAAGCDPLTALPTQWRPIAAVSTGAVTATTSAGVTSAAIDATAGGTAAAADNPYVYVDLVAGAKVELSDTAAAASTAWHLALKRSSLRLNGGDSGPGQVTAAAVAAGTLAEVTAAPAGLAADDWADAACGFVATPGGEPASVMAGWYDYDDQTHTLAPKAQVWVVKLGAAADAPMRKLRIVTYYGDPASPMRGAYYQLEWAAL